MANAGIRRAFVHVDIAIPTAVAMVAQAAVIIQLVDAVAINTGIRKAL